MSHLLAALVVLLSRLPLRVLHALSSFVAFLMGDVFGYRRKVVLGNLQNSFPEKDPRELRKIARAFYRHLADVQLEAMKLLTISDKELNRRCRMDEKGKALMQSYFDEGRSFIGLLGHFGNWEWVPPVTSLNLPFPVVPVYRPLKDKVFDRLMLRIRGRYAHELIPKNLVGRSVIRYQRSGKPFILGLIADQTPRPKSAYWTTFLSQDTPVYHGPEKLARSLDVPVFFVAMRRQQRGHYFMCVELITEKPADLKEGELSRRFMELLEKEIRQSPADWLWSHRRWKYTLRKK